MSLNDTLKSFLKEDNSNPSIPSPGNALEGLNHEEQERLLRELNSSLSALTDSPSLNPYYIVERIKTRLKLVYGLSFDDMYFLADSGTIEKPLFAHNSIASVYGGITQVIPVDNSWLKFFPYGLKIKLQFLKGGRVYNVNAEILAQMNIPETPAITEA